MEQRSIELKTNTSASCFVSCFLTTANQYRQTRYKTSQYRFKNQGAPLERLKDSVSGLWNLGCRSCLRVDPWVPSTIHVFNQMGTGECRWVQWQTWMPCHVTTEVPPLHAAPGGGVLLNKLPPVWGCSALWVVFLQPANSAFQPAHLLSISCASPKHMYIFHHGLLVSGGSYGARSG